MRKTIDALKTEQLIVADDIAATTGTGVRKKQMQQGMQRSFHKACSKQKTIYLFNTGHGYHFDIEFLFVQTFLVISRNDNFFKT